MTRISSAALTVVVVALAVTLIIVAIRELWIQHTFAATVSASRMIEKGIPISPATVSEMASLAQRAADEGICRSSLLRAGTTLVLRRVELVDRNGDQAAWQRATEQAGAYLRHSLNCLPTQGNFWLRMAMLQSLRGADPQTVLRMLRLSQLYSPAEEGVLQARLVFWRQLSQPILMYLEPILHADLRALCTKRNETAARALPPPTPPLWPYIERLSNLDPSTVSPWCKLGM